VYKFWLEYLGRDEKIILKFISEILRELTGLNSLKTNPIDDFCEQSDEYFSSTKSGNVSTAHGHYITLKQISWEKRSLKYKDKIRHCGHNQLTESKLWNFGNQPLLLYFKDHIQNTPLFIRRRPCTGHGLVYLPLPHPPLPPYKRVPSWTSSFKYMQVVAADNWVNAASDDAMSKQSGGGLNHSATPSRS
jgi:hypothetical protein